MIAWQSLDLQRWYDGATSIAPVTSAVASSASAFSNPSVTPNAPAVGNEQRNSTQEIPVFLVTRA